MADSFLDSELEEVGKEKTLLGILTAFGEEVADRLKVSLAKEGASDTGFLEQSIRWDVEPKGNGLWTFILRMGPPGDEPNYADFINQGVQGIGGKRKTDSPFSGKKNQAFQNKAPNSPFTFHEDQPLHGDMFKGWARRRGLDEWAVAQAVWRTGIKPNHFFDNVVNEQLFKELSENLETAGVKALESFIVNELLQTSK